MDTDHLDDEKLAIYARELGISVEELEELDYREDSEVSEDGLVYNHYIQFSDDNPWQIMVKIRGLEGDTVRFYPGLFESPEPD